MAYRHINRYVHYRLSRHLKRRSQRPYRLLQGQTLAGHFIQLGLYLLHV